MESPDGYELVPVYRLKAAETLRLSALRLQTENRRLYRIAKAAVKLTCTHEFDLFKRENKEALELDKELIDCKYITKTEAFFPEV
jgi:hypothetical protein